MPTHFYTLSLLYLCLFTRLIRWTNQDHILDDEKFNGVVLSKVELGIHKPFHFSIELGDHKPTLTSATTDPSLS